MNTTRLNGFCSLLILPLVLTAVSCRTQKAAESTEERPPPPPPINTIRIGDFKCDNEITALAVRNVFIEIIGRNRSVKVVREGEADVVVEGTVTYGEGAVSGNLGGGSNWAASRISGAGDYVSGVTAVSFRDGEILTSASWGQVIAKGKEILPPELVARHAAERLLGALYRHGLSRQ